MIYLMPIPGRIRCDHLKITLPLALTVKLCCLRVFRQLLIVLLSMRGNERNRG